MSRTRSLGLSLLLRFWLLSIEFAHIIQLIGSRSATRTTFADWHGKVVVTLTAAVAPHQTRLLFAIAVRGDFGGHFGGCIAPSPFSLLITGRVGSPNGASIVIGGSRRSRAGRGLSGTRF